MPPTLFLIAALSAAYAAAELPGYGARKDETNAWPQVLDGESWAHVAPAGDQVFVRGPSSLLAFGWE